MVPVEKIEGLDDFLGEAFCPLGSLGPRVFLAQGSAYIEGYLQGVRGISEFAK